MKQVLPAKLPLFKSAMKTDNQSAIVVGLGEVVAYLAEKVVTAQLATLSNADAIVTYAYTPDRLDAGYTITLANGNTFTRSVTRDAYRRSLVTAVTNTFNGVVINSYDYAYDALGRPDTRNTDSFGYNPRSEVSSATVQSNAAVYAYDDIGNFTSNSVNSLSTAYAANNLNQYTQIDAEHPVYDLNGNIITNGVWSYAYDAADRLATVSSNGVLLLINRYDAQSRRVQKITQSAIHTYFYDGWNLVEERVIQTNGTSETIQYVWGKDLSGTLQGAGGVGGLLWLKRNGAIYIPSFDANGNITAYADSTGTIVAEYVYDAFGHTISQFGPLANTFHHRFSTKYHDTETGLYYYGYRFYSPTLSRWLNRDPIEEDGGVNLYAFCRNDGIIHSDFIGLLNRSLPNYVKRDFSTSFSAAFGIGGGIKINTTRESAKHCCTSGINKGKMSKIIEWNFGPNVNFQIGVNAQVEVAGIGVDVGFVGPNVTIELANVVHIIDYCNEKKTPTELKIINFQIVPGIDNVHVGLGKLGGIRGSLKCWFDFQASADLSFEEPNFRGGIYLDHDISIMATLAYREYVLLSTTSFMNGQPTRQPLFEF